MLPDLEAADIFRRHGPAYRRDRDGHFGRVERRVMSAIELCRTTALGGHVEACEDCAHARIACNSCRNRHCPKCQGTARDQWLEARQADLLPVPYFHVVFTVPAEIAGIAYQNKALVYGILFDAVAATLKIIGADPRHLGGELGFIAILHTWGQTLTHHPHIHCLVPGGALSPDGRWLACRPRFFLPIHVLSRLFRRLFLERLLVTHGAGRLHFFGALAGLNDAGNFAEALRTLRKKSWVVYAKPPFGSPEHVLAYLGRYTHRVAIANSRLVSADEASVTFRWRDYAHGNAPRLMTLGAHEFIRRFLLHSLPDGFHRIRHYGFPRQWVSPGAAHDDPQASTQDQGSVSRDRRHRTSGTICQVQPSGMPLLWRYPTHHHSVATPMDRATAALARYIMSTGLSASTEHGSVTASTLADAMTPYACHGVGLPAGWLPPHAAGPVVALVCPDSHPIRMRRCLLRNIAPLQTDRQDQAQRH